MKISLLFKKMNIAIRAWKSKLLNIYFDKNISEKINKFVYWLMIKEVGNENDTQYLNNALANTIKQNGAILKQYREEHFSLDIDNLYTIYKKQYYREFQVIENEVQNKENATVEETILYFKTDYEYDLPIHVDVVNQLELPDLGKEYEFIYIQLKKNINCDLDRYIYNGNIILLNGVVVEEVIESDIYFGVSYNSLLIKFKNILDINLHDVMMTIGIYEILLYVKKKKNKNIIEKLREKIKIKEETLDIQIISLNSSVSFFNREVLYQDAKLKLYQAQEKEGINILMYLGCDFFILRTSLVNCIYIPLFDCIAEKTRYVFNSSAFSIALNYLFSNDRRIVEKKINMLLYYEHHYYDFTELLNISYYTKFIAKGKNIMKKWGWIKDEKVEITPLYTELDQLYLLDYIYSNHFSIRYNSKLYKYTNNKNLYFLSVDEKKKSINTMEIMCNLYSHLVKVQKKNKKVNILLIKLVIKINDYLIREVRIFFRKAEPTANKKEYSELDLKFINISRKAYEIGKYFNHKLSRE